MDSQPIGRWLDELASEAPAPGGGAAAALEAATGAALVEMVCNLTIGKPAYAEHEQAMLAVRGRASSIRAEALGLAAEDAAAFSAVIAAYRLPRETDAERASRTSKIHEALVGAAEVARSTAMLAAQVLDLAEEIAPIGNPNVISDAAAAAGAARAAVQTSLLNVRVNAAALDAADPARAELESSIEATAPRLEQADAIVATIRERLSG